MAVTAITEQLDRGGMQDPNVREYTRIYLVHTDNPLDDQVLVLAAEVGPDAIPAIGDVFPGDSEAKVIRIEAETFEGNPQLWEVRVDYSAGGITFGPTTNPLNDPPEVSIGSQLTLEPVEREIWHPVDGFPYPDDPRVDLNPPTDFRQTRSRDGFIARPIVNVNREKFDPPVQVEVHHLNVELTRNEPFAGPFGRLGPVSLVGVAWYSGAVNSDRVLFLGVYFAPRQLLIADIRLTLHNANGFRFWRVTYDILYRDEGWTKEVANLGYTTWRASADEQTIEMGRVKDDNGQDAGEPQWLTWEGLQIAKSRTATQVLPYIRFYVYREMPFSALYWPRTMFALTLPGSG